VRYSAEPPLDFENGLTEEDETWDRGKGDGATPDDASRHHGSHLEIRHLGLSSEMLNKKRVK